MPNSSANSLPEEFVNRLKVILPEDFESIIETFCNNKPVCFRVNQSKTNDSLVSEALKAIPLKFREIAIYPRAYELSPEDKSKLTSHPLFTTGQIYIQNISSMLTVDVLDPQPGEEVLDLAAAPGGKTLLIAERMKGEGYLAAVEAVRKRFFKLQSNLKTQNADWVRTFLADGRSIGNKTYERFDRVLLDAPCSSEARFSTRDPSSWENWSHRKVRESSRKQFGLIRSAFKALKPSGTLVYCTCSFSPEENEKVVDHLLKKFPESAQTIRIQLDQFPTRPALAGFEKDQYDPQVKNGIRIIPDSILNGMFVTKITKLKTLGEVDTKSARRTSRPKKRT